MNPEANQKEPPASRLLIIIAHPDRRRLGERYFLAPGESVDIGSAAVAGISLLNVGAVAPLQARLHHHGDTVIVESLGSGADTYLNGGRLGGTAELHSGDIVSLAGGRVCLKVLDHRDVEYVYHVAMYELIARDHLTGICNRRRFDEVCRQEVARAERYRRPLSLLLLDIDRFKQVNDRAGHLAGDRVLQQVAWVLQQVIRSNDTPARLGGDEFAILCPEVRMRGARRLAERILRAVRTIEVRDGERRLRVACSVGIAQLSPAMAGPQSLYAAADRMLYRAKRLGGDRASVQHWVPAASATASGQHRPMLVKAG